MATIDLTLDTFKIPNINGTFPFGTKITQTELNHGGLSTTEVNSNVMLPFMQMRPKVCDENSDTTQVEYDAKVVFNAPAGTTPSAGYTLTMGQGSYVGCTVTYTNLMEYACTVKQGDGTTTLFTIPAGKTMSAMWTGTAWRWTTSGTVSANDPTPVSSAAVQSAIGEVTQVVDLSDQITNKISIVTEAILTKIGSLASLTFRLTGEYTFSGGLQVMQLPIQPIQSVYHPVPEEGNYAADFILTQNGSLTVWWIGGSQYVDFMGTITFITA